jgi:mRNA interferase HigB
MHLISIRNLRADIAKYPSIGKIVDRWYATIKNAAWQNLEEVREDYPEAEAVGNLTVFNIKGNTYRLIVGMDYQSQTVYYKYFLTHAEYDKDDWKNNPYF